MSDHLLDQRLEDRFFKALLGHKRLMALISETLTADNFSSTIKHNLYKVLVQHYTQYNTIPTVDILLLETEELLGSESVVGIERYLYKLGRMELPEWEWILSKISKWVSEIRTRKAIYEASIALDEARDIDEIQTQLADQLRMPGILEEGKVHHLDLTSREIYDIAKQENQLVTPTRIYALDEDIRGLYRKELMVIMSPLNVGKSWAVVHLAQAALMSGCKVLYHTLEMSKARVLTRLIQAISGATTAIAADQLARSVNNWDDEFIDRTVTSKIPTLLDVNYISTQLGIINKWGGVFQCKEYSSGEASIADIERDARMFDLQVGHPPDLHLVDALTDINPGNTRFEKRHSLANITRSLRAMAKTHNMSVVVAHQANRESIDAELVTVKHTGEALAIMQTADIGITLNQTNMEYQAGLMRLHLARVRSSEKWCTYQLWNNLDIGQFCQLSRKLENDGTTQELPHGRFRRRTN